MPLVPKFPLGTYQSEQNVSSSLVYTMHSPLLVGPPFQRFDSSIRPLPSASLPGESSGIFTSAQPFNIRPKTKMSTSFSSDSESRFQRRDKLGASVESLTSQLSSESHGLPPNFTSPIISEGTVREQKKSKPILTPKTPAPGFSPEESPNIDPRHKQRAHGFERFEEITDKKKDQCKQIKQVKMDLARLLLTTGYHSCLLIVPPSWKVHKYATAGDFNTFLQMYTSALEAQQNLKRRETKFRIEELWERFHGRYGLHHVEVLCAALLESDIVVENFKDSYMSSLAGEQDQLNAARKKLSSHLNDALRAFVALDMND